MATGWLATSGSANATASSGYTSVNETADGSGHCKNGSGSVNCNIYDGKQYVWMNGGPTSAGLADGTYFFAVLEPSGQADPNDGSATNLSDDYDAYTNRSFTVSNGTVNYGGLHDHDGNQIRLAPYANTSNGGHEYIMAICSLDGGYPVVGGDCKYDAFKAPDDGTVTPADDLTITKDASGTYTNTYAWQITKNVDKTEIDNTGGDATFNYAVDVSHDGGTVSDVKVTGTISVFNPNLDAQNNPVPVDIDGVTDQLSDGTNCTVTNGGPQTLTQVETDFAYECDLTALPQGNLDNTASVAWSGQFLDNGALLGAGSADFIFTGITFAENAVDECVNVTDTLGGTLGTVCAGDANPTEFTYPYTFSGDPAGTCTSHDNTATFTTNDTGSTGSAGQTVKVCVGADLTVSKTASPAFTRGYNWSITKNVDKTYVKQLNGSVTFNYTVTVSETGYTDSGWTATGKITVSNPNDWEAITADVTDAVDNGGVCTVTGGTGVSVPASGSVTLDYTCSYASAPSPASGTNTATATWDAGAASTPDASATGTAAVVFSGPTTRVNQTVHVTDSYAGALGTVTATDSAPFTSKQFTYSRTVSVVANTCNSYPNTATITETGQSDSKTVTVCGAVAGGLTMGYWQNKNGQGIITNGASVSGVCKSATWLRQYAPFQDLSASATCTQVAAYVTNVIKAANSSGAAMNAMLKAQMLATALDVFFSDPVLGGNKINASVPLGGVRVDLTAICKMIDGSGGSASCSGTYQNVSAAFGGSTCLTISQLLSYAAGQSNAGGSAWYGNVKATQELAKNTFDAINNQVAFAC